MRIQTRLFLGTALLVVVLTATQWSLHRRQLAAIERELGAVATAVGKGILDEEVHVVVQRPGSDDEGSEVTWVGRGAPPLDEGTSAGAPGGEPVIAAGSVAARSTEATRFERVVVVKELEPVARKAGEMPAEGAGGGPQQNGSTAAGATGKAGAAMAGPARVELRVVTVGRPGERYLVLNDGSGTVRRIPIPVSPTQQIVRET